MQSIGWLHFTDLHIGQPKENGRLPGILAKLLDDLERLATGEGGTPAVPIDVVFFTGDIAFKGTPDEFARATASLGKILGRIRQHNHKHHKLGDDQATPLLVTVPGNHDLARPAAGDAAQIRTFRDQRSVASPKLWDGADSYREQVESCFTAYQDWLKHPLPFVPGSGGAVPGDARYEIVRNGMRLGVVGLNSAWTHLGDADDGQLLIDASQYREVVPEPGDWRADYDATFLLTHHPPHSLAEPARERLRQEIATTFDVHLYGHAHVGGHTADPGLRGHRHGLEGRSLFGPEEDGFKRMHGYTLGSLIRADGRVKLEIWPRPAWAANGEWQFGPAAPGPGNWSTIIDFGRRPALQPGDGAETRGEMPAGFGSRTTFSSWPSVAVPAEGRKRWLFLSAGVPQVKSEPDRKNERPFVDSARAALIRATVVELAERLATSDTGLIFGGEPGITACVAPALLHRREAETWFMLGQAQEYRHSLIDVVGTLDGLPGVRCCKEPGLSALRESMCTLPGLVGAVFLGGMRGVIDEFLLFGEKQPDLRRLALGLGGGAAADLLLGGHDALKVLRARDHKCQPWADPQEVERLALGAVPASKTEAITYPGRLWHSPKTAVDAIFGCFEIG